ncbi:hypothetical protein [Actinomadura mexicana]|uniref:hypothetical protein n=1 Tax=Actinomadura mexicana TaxID=134959 RepID=UPI00117732E4|nr:hypothetical protein [Actinomadura mexicana]
MKDENAAQRKAILTEYIRRVELMCTDATMSWKIPNTVPDVTTIAWWNQILNARNEFVQNWADSVNMPKEFTGAADMIAARENFRAASGFWAALSVDDKRRDWSAYNAHAGQYQEAMGGYLSALYKYFTFESSCLIRWPSPPLAQIR